MSCRGRANESLAQRVRLRILGSRTASNQGITQCPYPATSPSKALSNFFVLLLNDTITFTFDRVAQMEKLKKQLIEVETSIERVNDSLSEMQAERRLPFYVPSSASQTYQYLPMKADREIRLLYLEPGSSKSRLSCSLSIVTLSKTPVYKALSYTWGKPVFPASMKCSPSGQICITENLSVALCHLRLKDRVRVLWVDAICINQQDLVERSQQVSLMRDIYEEA